MFDPTNGVFHVVVNSDEQYSIWPETKLLPAGWTRTGFAGTKEDCLKEIARVWTDMRPKSLREAAAAK